MSNFWVISFKRRLVALNSLFPSSLGLERGCDAYSLAVTMQLKTLVQGKAKQQVRRKIRPYIAGGAESSTYPRLLILASGLLCEREVNF